MIRMQIVLVRKLCPTYKEDQGNLEMMSKKTRPIDNNIHTPWLTERRSVCVSASVNEFAVKLNAAGKSIAMTLIVNKEEFN
jgi:hypothetical protein